MQSDRFAREIVAILASSCAAPRRRLMRRPLGGIQIVLHLIHEAQGCTAVERHRVPHNLKQIHRSQHDLERHGVLTLSQAT